MTGRVPATDSSVSWPQHGYSYRTVLPAGREYEQLLRRRDGAGDEEPDELLLDVNELAGRRRLRGAGALGGLPGHLADGVLGGLRRRRGLRAAVPRPGHRGGPERRRAADGARRVPGRRTRRTSSTSSTTRRGGSTRSGGTGSARPATPTSWCWRSRTGSSSWSCTRRRTGDLVVIWSENRDTSEVWVVDAAAPDLGAALSVGGRRRGVEYHAEHVRYADGSDELLVVTNDEATEFRLARCPVPRSGRPGLVGVGCRCDPRTRPSGWSRWTRTSATWCSTSRSSGRNQLRILPLGRPHRRGHRRPAGLGHRVAVGAGRCATSSTTWTGSSSWTSPT